MSQYPRDEFDDVPEDSERRGAYRGREPRQDVSHRGFAAIIVAGCLSLLVGALMFIYQPRNLSPEAASSSSAATAESASSSPTAVESSAGGVEIYNGGAYAGAAAEVQQTLEDRGYTVAGTANWQGQALTTSVVYYSGGRAEEATALADSLGIGFIEEDPAAQADFYVVLGPDFPGVSAAGSQQADTGTDAGTGVDSGYGTGVDPGYGTGTDSGYGGAAGGYLGQ